MELYIKNRNKKIDKGDITYLSELIPPSCVRTCACRHPTGAGKKAGGD